MKKSYLFYDLETSGLNKSFDQILQFAAIRTDDKFNELERYDFLIKLRPDIIPSPGAIITHRIGISKTLNEGVTEYEAIKKIHKIINEPGTISIGYNNLGFDDEFLRFSFYRNLLDPYTHQYLNNCKRIDLLPIATVFRLFRKDIIQWPEINGAPTLRLEYISSVNNLAEGQAHNALVDVIATVELAKRLKADIKLWDYLENSFDKKIEHERIEKFSNAFPNSFTAQKFAIMINSKFGYKLNYAAPVLLLGESEKYKSQLWLRLDLEELSNVNSNSISENTFVIRKNNGGAEVLFPSYEKTNVLISSDRLKITSSNLKFLSSKENLLNEIINFHRKFEYPEIKNVDIDAKLYSRGFWSKSEKEEILNFNNLDWVGKVRAIKQTNNLDLKELFFRILYRNRKKIAESDFHDLSIKFYNKINPTSVDSPMIDFKGELKMVPQTALREIENIVATRDLDDEQKQLLKELKEYIEKEFPENESQFEMF